MKFPKCEVGQTFHANRSRNNETYRQKHNPGSMKISISESVGRQLVFQKVSNNFFGRQNRIK